MKAAPPRDRIHEVHPREVPVPVSLLQIIPHMAAVSLSQTDMVDRWNTRVRLGHVDMNLHMNYASYLNVMELGRWRLIARTGAMPQFLSEKIRAVVGGVDITYRRELKPRQKFTLDTRMIDLHRRALVVEQTFLVDDQVHAQAKVNALLLKNGRVMGRQTLRDMSADWIVDPLPVSGGRLKAS